jgi:hypothetical protein
MFTTNKRFQPKTLGVQELRFLLATVLAASTILFAPVAHADPGQVCAARYWWTLCKNPDGTWLKCNYSGDGQCRPVPAPAVPIPGIDG